MIMSKITDQIKFFKFLFGHPLTKKHKIEALKRWLFWQIKSRITVNDILVPFINNTYLSVHHGMQGATLNIYVGLAEFNDMSYAAHFLRPEDLFFDIGANVGVYTILASGVCGAKSISVEPIQTTYESLSKNVRLNHLDRLVNLVQGAVGDEKGYVTLTTDLDAMNHVESEPQNNSSLICKVPMFTLDDLANENIPQLIKIDVEGFEANVLRGGGKTLSSDSIISVILELNGSGKRYGINDEDTHKMMLEQGFITCKYEPFTRELSTLDRRINVEGGNTIYIRQNMIDNVKKRLLNASPIKVNGIQF